MKIRARGMLRAGSAVSSAGTTKETVKKDTKKEKKDTKSKTTYHTVKKGETLGKIADKYLGEKEILTAGFIIISVSTGLLTFINSKSLLDHDELAPINRVFDAIERQLENDIQIKRERPRRGAQRMADLEQAPSKNVDDDEGAPPES